MKFKTKLWKRSEKSFASTVPHIALLGMDENKRYDVFWEFNDSIQQWTFRLAESKPRKNRAGKTQPPIKAVKTIKPVNPSSVAVKGESI